MLHRVHPARRRWLLWGILALSFLLVNVYRLSTAVIAEDLMAAFRITGAQLGTIHATFFIVYAAMQLPTGVLVDRIGPRRTAAAGAAVMNVGAIWFSVAGRYGTALGARFLIGLGGSVIFVSMLRFCATWYDPAEFATMNGMSFAVSGVGGMLATTPFALVVEWLGWHETFRTLGLAGFVFAGAIALFVRDRPPTQASSVGALGLEGNPLDDAELRRHLDTVLRDRWVWVVGILLFCGTGVHLTLFGLWGIPYVAHVYETSVRFASMFTLLGGAGAVLGPPAIGWLAGRTGRRTTIIVGGGLCYTASLGVIALVGSPPLVVVGFAFFLVGGLLGAFVVSYPLINERHPSRANGIALGTINGAGFVGASVLPALMGWLLDAYWTGETLGGARVYTETGYRFAFGIATLAGAVTVLCGLWLYYQSPDAGVARRPGTETE